MGEKDCALVGLLLLRDEAGPGQKFSSLLLLDLKGDDLLGGEGDLLGGSSSVVGVFLDFLAVLEKKFIEGRGKSARPLFRLFCWPSSAGALSCRDVVTFFLYLWLAGWLVGWLHVPRLPGPGIRLVLSCSLCSASAQRPRGN